MPQVAVKVLRAVPYDDEAARRELRQVGSLQLLNFELSPITRFFSWQSSEAHLEVWCTLKRPSTTDFLGLTYEVPFPAAIILPYYSEGNSIDFIKREENANVLELVRLLFLLPQMCPDFYSRNQGQRSGRRTSPAVASDSSCGYSCSAYDPTYSSGSELPR